MVRNSAFVFPTCVLNALVLRCHATDTTTSASAATTTPTGFNAAFLASILAWGATASTQTIQATVQTNPIDESPTRLEGESTTIADPPAPPSDQSLVVASTLTSTSPEAVQPTETSIDPNIYYLPDLWNAPTPAVTCEPPCNIVLPPYTLSTPTTLSFGPLTTVLTEKWSRGSGTLTRTTSTVFSFDPWTPSVIPWFNLNITAGGGTQYSLTPSIFPVATGSIAPPSELSSVSALEFSITSFPPNPESTDGPTVAPFPFPIFPGAPPAVNLHVGPRPSVGVCLTDCEGGGLGGGLGRGCIAFCNSCGVACDGGGSSSGSGSDQCVGSGCHPPGEASQDLSDQQPPPPNQQPPPPDPKPTAGPDPELTTEPTTSIDDPSSTASSDSTTSLSSSSSKCEHSITVSNCRITCTDTATAGTIASQSSCYTGDCGSRITGCSGDVTGATTTTRTTTSVEACPYRPQATPWWTAPDQPVPTMPSYEDLLRSWREMGQMEVPDTQPAPSTSTSTTSTVSSTSSAQSTFEDSQTVGISRLASFINDPIFTSSFTSATSSESSTTSPETSPETSPPALTTTAELDPDIPIDIISEPTLGPGGVDMSTPECQACSDALKNNACMEENMKNCRIALCKNNLHCDACGINCRELYS